MLLIDWIACVSIVALVIIAMTAMSVLVRRCNLHPEIARKSLHVSFGLVASALPWIFSSVFPVLAGAATILVFLALVRSSPELRRTLGRSLHAVERDSLGDIYLVLGICIAIQTAPTAVDYAIAMLILSFADPAAAAAGMKFGRHPYGCLQGRKTLEGSAVFFVVAAAVSILVLAACVSVPAPTACLISLTVASACTLAEAVAGGGRDNLTVPAAAVLALLDPETAAMAMLLFVAGAGVLRFLALVRSRRVPRAHHVFN